jgi:DNA repair protein RadD
MIEHGYLTTPVQIDSPVAHYDFSSLHLRTEGRPFRMSDVEDLLKDQERVTPGIVDNVVELAEKRKGVMIFTASVRHAREILTYLPKENSAIVVGETGDAERDEIVRRFKARELKYLVNVSVLTTGFDAPHVDLIAVLRPTESVSLYQQIVGRGLRLCDGKDDCLVLDYTGMGHDIFSPEIGDDKPAANTEIVEVVCPQCGFENQFWGLRDESGEVFEHFGRKCRGAAEDPHSHVVTPCGFLFRSKRCDQCGAENDIAARACRECHNVLVDTDTRLREAMALKDAHVMRPDQMSFERSTDRSGRPRLEVRYYDLDTNRISEYFYLNTPQDLKAFYYNFIRMHQRRPEQRIEIRSAEDVISNQKKFRMPIFVIARKQKYYWQVREKIFMGAL